MCCHGPHYTEGEDPQGIEVPVAVELALAPTSIRVHLSGESVDLPMIEDTSKGQIFPDDQSPLLSE